VQRLVDLLGQAKRIVAFTGAGVSTESGLPDYRGEKGVWKDVDPMAKATRDVLLGDPVGFWESFRELFLRWGDAQPNACHKALAKLEEMGLLQAVVTQNIDGLHQKAGSRHVYELHGHLRTVRCMHCERSFPIDYVKEQAGVPSCSCSPGQGSIRPDVVLFGDPIPVETFRAAEDAIAKADLIMVLGTSLAVAPACWLPLNKGKHARTVYVNLEPPRLVAHPRLPTFRPDLIIQGKVGEVMAQVMTDFRVIAI